MLILIIIVLGIGLIVALAKYAEQKRNQAFTSFSAKYGLTYEPKVQDQNYGGLVKGKVSNRAYGVDKATQKAVQIFYLTHREHTGGLASSNSQRREVYRRTVASISLKNTNNTHIFLDSKVSENNPSDTVMLSSERRYKAEGDFGEFFNLYFPEGDQITALSIFAPDVMSLIVGYYGEYDIEIKNNTLFLYQYRQADNAEAYEKLYQAAYALAHAIDDNAPRPLTPGAGTAPARSADGSAQSAGVPLDAGKDITLPLKGSKLAQLTVLIVIIAGVTSMIFSRNSIDSITFGNVVNIAFVVFALVMTAVQIRRRKKYQQVRKMHQQALSGQPAPTPQKPSEK